MEIIQIGLYPPPYGGVSIHIKRLHEKLLLAGFNSLVVNLSKSGAKVETNVISKYGKLGWIIPVFFRKEKCVFHFHNCSVLVYLCSFLFSLRHIVVLSVHNPRNFENYLSSNSIRRRIYRILLSPFNYIIVDNQETLNLGKELLKSTRKFRVIPEFIPPAEIPPIEDHLINGIREDHKFVLSSNAWKLCFYKEEDMYGVDLLIDLTHILRTQYAIDVVFIFLLPQIGDNNYFQVLQNKIREFQIEKYFHFILDPIPEASSLWQISDIVIRATNTDGNSLTVLEALACNVPVLASDCSERHPNVHLFKTRNIESLVKEALYLLNSDINNLKIESHDNFESFKLLYSDILNKNS